MSAPRPASTVLTPSTVLAAVAAFVARRQMSGLVAVLMFVGAMVTSVWFVLGFVGDAALHGPFKPGVAALVIAGVVVIVVGFFGVGMNVLDRAERIERIERAEQDLALSAKYGVSIKHRHNDVWEVDGEPRQGTLTAGDTLLIGGRELARV